MIYFLYISGVSVELDAGTGAEGSKSDKSLGL